MQKTRIVSLALIVGLLMIASIPAGNSVVASRSYATESKDTKLNRLLNERFEVLEQIVAQMEDLHKLRVTGLKDLYAARVAMYRAKLELCRTDQERIEVLESLLGEAMRRETTEKSTVNAGAHGIARMASSLPAEEARADRLNIEIELERLKIK